MSDYDVHDSGAYGNSTPHTSGSLYPDPVQGRPQSGYPSSVTRRAPRYSRPANPSWVSNGMLSPPQLAGPPSTVGSRPLPVPSPTPSRGVPGTEFRPQYPTPSELDPDPYRRPSEAEPEEWEPETERMTIGPSEVDEHYDVGYPHDVEPQTLPEYERHYQQTQGQPQRDSFYDHMATDEPEPKPKKKTFVGGFVAGLRKLPKAVVKSHLYDRKATRKGAPGTEQPTGQSHYLPAYDEPGVTVTDPASVHYVEAVEMPPGPRSPSSPSYTDPTRPSSNARSPRHSSQRQSGQSNTPSVMLTRPPPIRTTPPGSPVLVSPHPASDYAKMESPVRFAPPDDSFSAHITRVKGFIHELRSLPWTSSRVALDYVPAQSSRARVGKAKQAGSWYTGVGPHQDVDLLGSARMPPRRLGSEDGGGSVRFPSAPIAIAHDGRTPASFVTSPGLFPSPGMSSHGQGQHPTSYSYYFAPPQPLYVYSSPMSTPAAANPAIAVDSSSSSSSRREQHTQAVPVYMMAGPSPGLIPAPLPMAHTSSHNQPMRTSPNTLPPGLPLSQAASHHSHSASH
ncbi:hypothetical protein BD413DRAFT_142648 [Trametes elegans]|nr:hypothetical protein BD413DRAFT_142648 [Trametes elegans]